MSRLSFSKVLPKNSTLKPHTGGLEISFRNRKPSCARLYILENSYAKPVIEYCAMPSIHECFLSPMFLKRGISVSTSKTIPHSWRGYWPSGGMHGGMHGDISRGAQPASRCRCRFGHSLRHAIIIKRSPSDI